MTTCVIANVTVFANVPVTAARTNNLSPAVTERFAVVLVSVNVRLVFAVTADPPVTCVVFAAVAASNAAEPAPACPKFVTLKVM